MKKAGIMDVQLHKFYTSAHNKNEWSFHTPAEETLGWFQSHSGHGGEHKNPYSCQELNSYCQPRVYN